VEERGLDPRHELTYQREPEHLVLARVLLAQDRPAQALALLARLHVAADAQRRAASVIEIGALLALAARGDRVRFAGRADYARLSRRLRPGLC